MVDNGCVVAYSMCCMYAIVPPPLHARTVAFGMSRHIVVVASEALRFRRRDRGDASSDLGQKETAQGAQVAGTLG